MGKQTVYHIVLHFNYAMLSQYTEYSKNMYIHKSYMFIIKEFVSLF